MAEEHNTFTIDFHNRKDFDFKEVELTTSLIINEALKRNIHAEFILGKYLELAFKGEKKLFHLADNTSLSYLAQQISASKTETKVFLKRAGISVPEGKRFKSNEITQMIDYACLLDGPIVIKPDNGSEGKGVYCGVLQKDIEAVVKEIGNKFQYIIVERQVEGNEYRVFFTNRNYMAVCMRRPASVLGDGKQTIEELINEKNIGRQSKKQKPLTCPFIRIEVDDVVQQYLTNKGMTIQEVPLLGERVYLRNNSNISTGGDGIELTDYVHPSVKEIASRALRAIPGMSYAGIDLMTKDITQDITSKYTILEMNNMPGIRSLHYPYQGKSQNVAGSLIDLVFPETS